MGRPARLSSSARKSGPADEKKYQKYLAGQQFVEALQGYADVVGSQLRVEIRLPEVSWKQYRTAQLHHLLELAP